jgi:putative glutamine amidotransferase
MDTPRPTIAISPCKKPLDYDAAVRQAGGVPRLLDLADAPGDALNGADGVLLTGGDDVDPSLYGEAPHPTVEAAEAGRDAFEIALVRHALEVNLPIFAICRGLQVLNVALGGTLIQDIPSEPSPHLPHDAADSPALLAHTVELAPGSCVAHLLGPDRTRAVNSRHHQAIRVLGRGLVATATAPDGVVEAVEVPAARFCVGVQWHPENFHRTGEFSGLFEGFVTACRDGKVR